ncbi:amidohydrolase family protein [Verticiella sediminum]|uniref:Amidohydrolase family protein n=1 Tax=Verticiella sediminum TaxID=1247510 RepID=A0A556ARJ5_9BURK|nr:amidohydrolase family protein [Verticiella sediminum]TSH95546.1 amidohydrolase family protein [Verticiella sediminum]
MSCSLVRAKWIVTGVQDHHTPQVVNDGALAHENGKVIAIGPFEEMRRRYPEAPVTHHPRHALLPGFVNSHHHVGLTPLQLGSPDYALELWFASRMSARDVDLYLDTLYSAFEMIASGVTTVQHIHGWMRGTYEHIHGAASAVLNAYRSIGMRASYCYAVREQNRLVYEDDATFCASLPPEIGRPLAEHLEQSSMRFDEHIQLYRQLNEENAGHPLTRIQLAPANLHWITDDGLTKLVDLARADNVPLHMHLLETVYQKEYARRRTGTTAVGHLHELGVLGPWMTLGHAVWLTEEDVELVAHSGTCVCHNCSSNFRLRSGMAPINQLARRGVTIGMGLDEAGINDDRDMLQEMRLALRVHRVPGMDDDDVPTVPQVLRMATEHGAKTTAFRGEIGRLEVGACFDAVAIDYEAATYPFQDEDVPMLDVLIQRARQKHVDTVYIGGDDVYVQGRFKHIDRDKVLGEIAEQLSRPRTAGEEARRKLSKAVFPHVKAFYEHYLEAEPARRPFYML